MKSIGTKSPKVVSWGVLLKTGYVPFSHNNALREIRSWWPVNEVVDVFSIVVLLVRDEWTILGFLKKNSYFIVYYKSTVDTTNKLLYIYYIIL